MCVTSIPKAIFPKDFTKEDGTIDFKKGYEFCDKHNFNFIYWNNSKDVLQKTGLTADEWTYKFREGVKRYEEAERKKWYENNIQQNNSFWKRLLCYKSFWHTFRKRSL